VQLVADLEERCDEVEHDYQLGEEGFVPITLTVAEARVVIGALKERYALP
jgi:hypothetical protein